MAYGPRSRRRTRRSFARRRPVARRPRRRAYRSRSVRRPMTRRRILNVTSKKKQDNMVPVSTSATGTNPATRGYVIGTTQAVQFIWCATARDRESNQNNPTADSVRESSTCFMRGLKERVFITTNSPVAWRWRRICFTAKGYYTNQGGAVDSLQTSQGWVRLLSDQNTTPFGNAVLSDVFAGTQNVDWFDVFAAKTDNSRLTIKYDRTITINSGNQNGVFRSFNQWHPMNKNLVYNDDELGEDETVDWHSTTGKAGMGDYYVVDFITSNGGTGGTTPTDTLTFSPEATLYWHEK